MRWLGDIPADWQLSPLKRIARLQYGESLPTTERSKGEVLVMGSNGPVGNHESANTKAPVLIVGRKGSCGRINYNEKPVFAIDTAYYVDQASTSQHLRWLYYVLQWLALDKFAGDSAIPGLSRELVYCRVVPTPPRKSQVAIAAFLDRETAKIDRLIEEKQRLIELLEEKRTALITRAVTKGLDPDIEMKDSGVEWLGEIPAHWQVVKLKRTWERADYGLSLSLAGTGSVPILTMGHLQDGGITIPEVGSLDLDSIPSDLFLSNGDLLYNRTNSLALVGKVGLFEEPDPRAVSFASYLVRLRLKRGASPRYYNYLLNTPSFLELVQSHSLLSVNQANLNPTRYGELSVPLPRSHEQVEIVRFLDREGASLRQLRESIIKAVDLLTEYRASLISAAVTGKIDVRDHAA